MLKKTLPRLGVGLNLTDACLDEGLAKYLPYIDCLEIKPEHYFFDVKTSAGLLSVINERLPLIGHGLFMSIGSAEGLSKRRLNKWDRFFSYAPSVPWVGEHMGCTRAGGNRILHFINVPYDDETLAYISANIAALKRRFSTPFIFENIPWAFNYPESTMDEAEFFARLVKKTGCGLLLDVTNLYANCHNFGWDLDDYLRRYPIDHIVQIHFNGGYLDKHGIYVDSHSKPTPPEIWDIIKIVLKRGAPANAVILERDDSPSLEVLTDELVKAKQYLKRYGSWH